jgi:hypothetical protein
MSDFNSASGAVRQELPPISCHVCGDPLRSGWVYLSARALAGRLYQLDLCGVCWPLLQAVIHTEVTRGERVGRYRAGGSSSPAPAPRRRRVKSDP